MARRSVLVLAVALGALVTSAPSRATVTEYPTCSLPPTADGALCADGRSPNSIVAGPDGAVWFTTYGGGEVGRITIAGAITLFNVPRPAGESSDVIRGPAGITAGPDGALWYAEDFGNRVGRVATDGTYTTYDVPGARPADIAVGPDGALWFTAAGTNSIGRITTTGSVSSFPLPAPGGASIKKLGGIVRGGDDRLWFAEVQGRKIGAIRTDGTLKEYPVPAGVGTPYDLTAGPDGAVWFSLFDGDRVGRITPGGAMRFFHLPAGSGPSGLTFASDGGLWIGASGRSAPSAILRMRPSDGSLTPTPLLYASSVNGMAEGPDHAVWFTETGPNQIGRITTATTVVPVVTPVTPGPSAAPVLIPPPAFAVPGTPELTGGALRIGLNLSARAAVDLAAAVVRRHRPVILGRGSVRAVGAGKHTARLKLTASGRRILARSRHPKVVVAARARGGDRRRATRERTARLR
jgi:virginiamycin B lyase